MIICLLLVQLRLLNMKEALLDQAIGIYNVMVTEVHAMVLLLRYQLEDLLLVMAVVHHITVTLQILLEDQDQTHRVQIEIHIEVNLPVDLVIIRVLLVIIPYTLMVVTRLLIILNHQDVRTLIMVVVEVVEVQVEMIMIDHLGVEVAQEVEIARHLNR